LNELSAVQFRTYNAYGLVIRSEIPLDEFPETAAGRADVVVAYGRNASWTASLQERSEAIEISANEARFWFADVGGFTVTGGEQIVTYARHGVPAGLLRLYVEGMLMAMLLHQRGMCVLHASVVEIEGRSIALMGQVGVGKSSLAGALYARGHRVLADDNAAILLSDGPPAVTPACPYLKLFPAVASVLGFQNGALRMLHASQAKMAGAVTQGFITSPTSLSRIYVLGRHYQPEVKRLSPLAATIELIRNAVPTRWAYPGDAGQLQRCGVVARQIPAFTLRTFTNLVALPGLARAVEQYCTS
jgi:hypothetical protein